MVNENLNTEKKPPAKRKPLSPFVKLGIFCFYGFFFLAALWGIERAFFTDLETKIIRLEVPDGFVGPLILELDKENGQTVSKENGVYVYRFPKNGRIRVKSFKSVLGSIQVSAIYVPSHKPIPNHSHETDDSTVALRGGGASEGIVTYCICRGGKYYFERSPAD